MAATADKPQFSMTHLSLGAILLMVAASLFGIKSGGPDGKADGKPAENLDSPFLYNPTDNAEPHRKVLLDYLQGVPGPRVEKPPGAALPPLVDVLNKALVPPGKAGATRQAFSAEDAKKAKLLIVT